MKSMNNYLRYNWDHNVDGFRDIVTDLITGKLLPGDMNEEVRSKMILWFGSEWYDILGYDNRAEGTDCFSVNSDEAEIRRFFLNKTAYLFDNNIIELWIDGGIVTSNYNICIYFDVFQKNENKLSIYASDGEYRLYTNSFSVEASGDCLSCDLTKTSRWNNDEFVDNVLVCVTTIFPYGGERAHTLNRYFSSLSKQSLEDIYRYHRDIFTDSNNSKKVIITVYEVTPEGEITDVVLGKREFTKIEQK